MCWDEIVKGGFVKVAQLVSRKGQDPLPGDLSRRKVGMTGVVGEFVAGRDHAYWVHPDDGGRMVPYMDDELESIAPMARVPGFYYDERTKVYLSSSQRFFVFSAEPAVGVLGSERVAQISVEADKLLDDLLLVEGALTPDEVQRLAACSILQPVFEDRGCLAIVQPRIVLLCDRRAQAVVLRYLHEQGIQVVKPSEIRSTRMVLEVVLGGGLRALIVANQLYEALGVVAAPDFTRLTS